MPTLFAIAFARALGEALTHAGWQESPHGGRWTYAPLGLTVRIVGEARVAVRREGAAAFSRRTATFDSPRGQAEHQITSGHGEAGHAAIHVARQLHALRAAAQAEADAIEQGASHA